MGNPSLPGVINALFFLNAESLTGFTEASRIIYSEVTVPRQLEAKDGTFTEVICFLGNAVSTMGLDLGLCRGHVWVLKGEWGKGTDPASQPKSACK